MSGNSKASATPKTGEPAADNLAGVKRITPWEKKMEQRKKQEAVKQREKEMKEEKIAEAERKSILQTLPAALAISSSYGGIFPISRFFL
ncbi:hypothetical protein IE53DRAFT_390440 [Violaceomyces palustris]|uniref:Uncharacterized protein n=1 Tax=Violaceomyces palustris TaxID=1673888 RepID=A0ACD0NNM3_9BASI|nr:hypothetical protein IE53DRAFT_390440 [Violaceomyces palustris]